MNAIITFPPFQSSNKEQIHFTISEFNGKQYIEIRIHTVSDDGTINPTMKEIRIPREMYSQFVQVAELINIDKPQVNLFQFKNEPVII